MSEVKERKIEAGLSQDVINKYSELEIQRSIKVVENDDVSIFCMDFGDAVRALKDGKRVARKGWNGKGMFLYFVPAGNYSPCTEVAKQLVNEDGLVPYAPYIAMKTAQGYVVPWLASQTDILSDDWEIV